MQQNVQTVSLSAQPTVHVNLSPLDVAIAKAQATLLHRQAPAGYWCGELQGDSILESEYILLRFILNQENEPELPLIANYLRSLQAPHGGWAMYPGGAADLSGTVKAYFALKLMGDDPSAPHMTKARDVVLVDSRQQQRVQGAGTDRDRHAQRPRDRPRIAPSLRAEPRLRCEARRAEQRDGEQSNEPHVRGSSRPCASARGAGACRPARCDRS